MTQACAYHHKQTKQSINMADALEPITTVLKNEGGYARAFGKSGETYMGIDRLHHPGWAGWKIIDQHKATVGPIGPKQVLKNEELFKLVYAFYYQKFWPVSKAALLTNQQLANMYFDFYFHKPAIAQAALKTASSKKTLADAIAYANQWPEFVYAKFYNLRISHYSNNWMNGSGKNRIFYKPGKSGSQAGVMARAKRFPAFINNQPLQNFVSVFS